MDHNSADTAFNKALSRVSHVDRAIGAVQSARAAEDRFAVAAVIGHFRDMWPAMVQAATEVYRNQQLQRWAQEQAVEIVDVRHGCTRYTSQFPELHEAEIREETLRMLEGPHE